MGPGTRPLNGHVAESLQQHDERRNMQGHGLRLPVQLPGARYDDMHSLRRSSCPPSGLPSWREDNYGRAESADEDAQYEDTFHEPAAAPRRSYRLRAQAAGIQAEGSPLQEMFMEPMAENVESSMDCGRNPEGLEWPPSFDLGSLEFIEMALLSDLADEAEISMGPSQLTSIAQPVCFSPPFVPPPPPPLATTFPPSTLNMPFLLRREMTAGVTLPAVPSCPATTPWHHLFSRSTAPSQYPQGHAFPATPSWGLDLFAPCSASHMTSGPCGLGVDPSKPTATFASDHDRDDIHMELGQEPGLHVDRQLPHPPYEDGRACNVHAHVLQDAVWPGSHQGQSAARSQELAVQPPWGSGVSNMNSSKPPASSSSSDDEGEVDADDADADVEATYADGTKITREMLQQMFHMEQREAAKMLNLKPTIFKAIQKQLNIPRWPYRLISSIETLANTIRQEWEDGKAKQSSLAKIAEARAAVIDFRIKKLPPELARLRQKAFKDKFSKKAAGASSSDKLIEKAPASRAKRLHAGPTHAGSPSLPPT